MFYHRSACCRSIRECLKGWLGWVRLEEGGAPRRMQIFSVVGRDKGVVRLQNFRWRNIHSEDDGNDVIELDRSSFSDCINIVTVQSVSFIAMSQSEVVIFFRAGRHETLETSISATYLLSCVCLCGSVGSVSALQASNLGSIPRGTHISTATE